MTGCTASVPEHLLRAGRPKLQLDHDGQHIYLRITSDWLDDNGGFVATAVPFPDTSVNTSILSEPRDVLVPIYLDWGCAKCAVTDVPQVITDGKGRPVHLDIEHEPIEINYAHCEIQARGESAKPPKSVRKYFRAKLAEALHLVIQPKMTDELWDSEKHARRAYWESICRQHNRPDWVLT